MKKKGILFVVLLFFLTVAVVYLGYSYSDKQQEELIHATSTAADTEVIENNDETTETTDPTVYEENRDELSVLNYLKYIGTKKDATGVAFYGQLSEAETWTEDVVKAIETELSTEVIAASFGETETDSYELYINNTAQELVETNADVVFFMIPALGDQVRDISLVDAKDYLKRNVTQIQEVLPDALVVLVSPSPTTNDSVNSRMLDYTQYINSELEVAEENDWPLVDIHTVYMEKLTVENLALTDLVQEDGFTLNSQGEEFLTELFIEQLSVPVNTTSGMN